MDRNKIFISTTLAIIVILVLFFILFNKGSVDVHRNYTFVGETSFDVADILDEEYKKIEDLAQESIVIEASKQTCQENENLSEEEVGVIDQAWRSGQDLENIDFCRDDTASDLLSDFVSVNEEFKEIILADSYGLLVAASGRTTDYDQSDEEWWQEHVAENHPSRFRGSIFYDESVDENAYSLSVPVVSDGQVYGVLKAVVPYESLIERLEEKN